jgi:hypothetical protein
LHGELDIPSLSGAVQIMGTQLLNPRNKHIRGLSLRHMDPIKKWMEARALSPDSLEVK